jgi:enediyne biosynthesis protein E4
MTSRTVGLCLLTALLTVALGMGGLFLARGWLWPEKVPGGPMEVEPARERQAIPVPKLHFTDVTDAAGIRFRHFNGAAGQKFLPETMGAGVAVLDYDGDGRQDLLFVNSCSWPGASGPAKTPCLALYRNKGDGAFEDVTEEAGLAVTMYGMGVAVGDFDNDGHPDLYVTGVGGNHLFHNVEGPGGRRRFVDVTVEAGVGGPGGWPTVANGKEFSAWQKPIAFASSATFLDYDGDGRLDLFVCYYVTWSPAKDLSIEASLTGVGRAYLPPQQFEGAQCVLYRNVDGSHFKDVSAEAGVQVFEHEGTDENARVRNVGKSLGVVVCDPDEDGWPDLVVANDTVRNFFFHNVPGPDGSRRFKEEGLTTHVAYAEGKARGAMGIDWGEYRPGKNALLIGNFANEPDTFLTLDNPKKLLFSDAALAVGLYGPSLRPLKFGTLFFDCDNDGRLDLLTCNGHLEPEIGKVQVGQTYEQPVQLFWNTGGGQRLFEPVTAADAGEDLFKPLVGRGCAVLDFNNDGKLDLVLMENNGPARLLSNDNDLKHHWIRLTLEGDGKRSNRSAIGAQITVEAGDQTLRRQVSGARGYLSQSELPVSVGLGDAAKVERVTVRWPGKDAGPRQVWADLDADRAYELKQGEAQAKPLPKERQ